MLTWLTPHATALAVAVTAAELSVGVAVLAGAWTRWAACAGALLNLSFALTVNWAVSPWFENPDVAYVAGWAVLAVAAPLPASVDTWVRARPAPSPRGTVSRRFALQRLAATAAGLVILGALSAVVGLRGGRRTAGQPGVLAKEQVAAPPHTPSTVAAGSLAPGQAVIVADPAGRARWLIHVPGQGFVALGTLCTHAYCPLQFLPGMMQLGCPCHGSMFDARTGAMIDGPATTALPRYPVTVSGGKIHVQ